MNGKSRSKIISCIIILSTIISCTSININGGFKEYKTPEKGLVLSIISEQNEIRIRNPNGYYNPMASILIVDIDNAYIADQRLKELSPVLDNLKGFDFSSQISKQITKSVSKIGWLKIDKELSSRKHLHNILQIGTHHLLFNMKYEFTPNMDSIEVTVFVTLKKVTKIKTKRNKKVSKYSVIYENRYKYISPIANPLEIISSKKSDVNNELKIILGPKKKIYSRLDKLQLMSTYWSFNKSNKVKKYLNEAINRTKEMISYDLSFKKELADIDYYNSLKTFNQFYWKINSVNDRLFLESSSWLKKGNLCSIPVGAETYRCTNDINF